MRQAWALYGEGASFSLSMYVAGVAVAVESMLRAYKLLRDPTFDEKHDLRRLFKASGMLTIDPDVLEAKGLSKEQTRHHFRELQSAVSEVCDLWANDYRFASEGRMRAHLKSRRLDRGVKGDFLKTQALTLLVSAQKFIDKGVYQWGS